MIDTYDEQIAMLVKGDYEGFCKVVSYNQGRSLQRHVHNLKDAWSGTGGCETSLFAYLPGSRRCASQIDYTYDMDHGSMFEQDMLYHYMFHANGETLLESPTVNELPLEEYLQEFARRQRLARSTTQAP